MELGNLTTKSQSAISDAVRRASMAGNPHSDSGMAAGIGSTMRYLGGIVGIAILGHGLQLTGSRDEIVAQHHMLLVIFAAVLVVTLGCAALLGPRARAAR